MGFWLRAITSWQNKNAGDHDHPCGGGCCHGLRRSTLWPLSICKINSVLQSRQNTGSRSATVSGSMRSSRLFRRHTGQVIHPSTTDILAQSAYFCKSAPSISAKFASCSTKLQVPFLIKCRIAKLQLVAISCNPPRVRVMSKGVIHLLRSVAPCICRDVDPTGVRPEIFRCGQLRPQGL